ncbi:MAG: transposase [Candidatus Magasanikbacteria bacterium]|nr:transposase [Candidatus Magasanikbacteria bacterium]
MASPIPQEVKAKILSSIKDDGVSIAQASTTYNVTEETLRKWLRATIDNGGTSSSEIQRLRRENQQLKEIIGTLLLEKEATKKNITRS